MIKNYTVLQDIFIKDFNTKDFVYIKKIKKQKNICKIFLAISYIIMCSSLILDFSKLSLIILLIGLMMSIHFYNRIKIKDEILINSTNSFELMVKKYLNSAELHSFRKQQFNALKDGKHSVDTYKKIAEQELRLILNLIKLECEESDCIDVVTYKNDIESIFLILKNAFNEGLISKDDYIHFERKFNFDMRVLTNQYAGTYLDVDLKFLNKIDIKLDNIDIKNV